MLGTPGFSSLRRPSYILMMPEARTGGEGGRRGAVFGAAVPHAPRTGQRLVRAVVLAERPGGVVRPRLHQHDGVLAGGLRECGGGLLLHLPLACLKRCRAGTRTMVDRVPRRCEHGEGVRGRRLRWQEPSFAGRENLAREFCGSAQRTLLGVAGGAVRAGGQPAARGRSRVGKFPHPNSIIAACPPRRLHTQPRRPGVPPQSTCPPPSSTCGAPSTCLYVHGRKAVAGSPERTCTMLGIAQGRISRAAQDKAVKNFQSVTGAS